MKIVLIVLAVLVLLYLFLIAPRLWKKPDRTPYMGIHYAHRGLFDNKSEAPENSLAAFRKAVEAGYGIELDVQLSKDDVLVVFHDATLERMCGVKGNVWDFTYDELQELTLAKSGERIPKFEEVLNLVDGKVPLIVEYKLDRVQTKVCELGNKLLKQYKGAYCIESFHPLAVKWYRKNRPDVLRGQLSMNFKAEYKKHKEYILLTYLLTNVATRPDFIAYQHSDASVISRKICRVLGALSVTWTIKNQKQYEAVKDEFDLFIFDSCILK
jgi:glycerophosphoryl diester phosphodiesterase